MGNTVTVVSIPSITGVSGSIAFLAVSSTLCTSYLMLLGAAALQLRTSSPHLPSLSQTREIVPV